MTIQVQRDLTVVASDTSSQVQILAKRVAQFTDAVSMTEQESGKRLIPAATNQQINLGGVDAVKVLYVEASAAVKIRLSEAGDPFPVGPNVNGAVGIFYAEGLNATEVWIENEGTSAVTVFFLAGG